MSAECPPVTNGMTTYVFELPQVIENDIGEVRIQLLPALKALTKANCQPDKKLSMKLNAFMLLQKCIRT